MASWRLPHGLINDVSKINDYAFRGTPRKSFFFQLLHFATFQLPSFSAINSSCFKLFLPAKVDVLQRVHLFACLICHIDFVYFFPLVHRFSFLYFFLCKWERTFVSIKLGLNVVKHIRRESASCTHLKAETLRPRNTNCDCTCVNSFYWTIGQRY